MAANYKINYGYFQTLDSELIAIAQAANSRIFRAGLRNQANRVLKRLEGKLPKPGYPGDSDEAVQLRQNLGTIVIGYQNGLVLVAMSGYKYGGRAFYGHLVELGHRMVTRGTTARLSSGLTPRSRAKDKIRAGYRTGAGRVVGFVSGVDYLSQSALETKAERDEIINAAARAAIEQARAANERLRAGG